MGKPKDKTGAAVPVRVLPAGSLFLHSEWGTGELGKHKFSYGQALPGTVYVSYKGRYATLDTEALVRSAAEAIDAALASEPARAVKRRIKS